MLSEALWAQRISRHGATKFTAFELVYGQQAVLPVEMNPDAYRLAKQNDLFDVDYHDLMMDNIDGSTDKQLKALKEIEKDKLRMARPYNKMVKDKSFQVGELVWKIIVPLGTKSNKFGKWSPSWEGPYKIIKVIFQKFIYVGDVARRSSTQGYQWKILEKILPQRVARCVKREMANMRYRPYQYF